MYLDFFPAFVFKILSMSIKNSINQLGFESEIYSLQMELYEKTKEFDKMCIRDRERVVKLLNNYVQNDKILKNIDEYIVLPKLKDDSALLGALALCFKK